MLVVSGLHIPDFWIFAPSCLWQGTGFVMDSPSAAPEPWRMSVASKSYGRRTAMGREVRFKQVVLSKTVCACRLSRQLSSRNQSSKGWSINHRHRAV